MIVINRKRITAILTCILIGVFVFILGTSKKEKEVIETVTLPVSGKTVVIDAGHGIPDERSRKFERNNRSTNKPSNSTEVAKFIRAKWMYSNTYTFR